MIPKTAKVVPIKNNDKLEILYFSVIDIYIPAISFYSLFLIVLKCPK
jgi:hypothetical protein